jgi:hypothetical protein
LRDPVRPPATTGVIIARAALGAGAGTIAIGALGFLMSVAFNQSLGREDFVTDRAIDWWMFGARSVVAPLVLAAVVLLVAGVTLTLWRGLSRVLPPARTFAATVRSRSSRITGGGRLSSAALAQWLLVGQTTAIAATWWHFRRLLEAVINPDGARAADLALLSQFDATPLVYRSVLTVLIVAMSAAWYVLLSRPGARTFIPRTTRIAGAAVILCALLMIEVPYRLLYHAVFRPVTFDGQACHETGESPTELLLYCRDADPPRIRRVARGDQRLTTPALTTEENIF